MTAAEHFAVDREQLLAELKVAPIAEPKRVRAWRVVRQFTHLPERTVCSHRWEWQAEMCARRLTARHSSETGGHYTPRRTEA